MEEKIVNDLKHIDINIPDGTGKLNDLLKEIEQLKERISRIESSLKYQQDIPPGKRNTGYGFMLYI